MCFKVQVQAQAVQTSTEQVTAKSQQSLTEGLVVQSAASRYLNHSSNAGNSNTTAFGCPKHPVYSKPWVKQNIALSHSLKIRDGLGGQVLRIMATYAIAQTLGIGYVHKPIGCVGHIGPHIHYRRRTCGDLKPSDLQQLQRISKYIRLPNTHTNTSNWKTTWLFKGTWDQLAEAVQSAAERQQPTVIQLEVLNVFIHQCPNSFHHVPSWQPNQKPNNINERVSTAVGDCQR